MFIPVLTPAEVTARQESLRRPWHNSYLTMYSSVLGGIVTDPVLMCLPMDDHLVHRGDGVFDACKCVDGKAYCLEAHLERLERSAAGIELALPREYQFIHDILKAAVKTGGVKDVMIRIYISRGPGGFTTNPYECPASQLYVVVTRLKRLPDEYYEHGVPLVSVPVPVKAPAFAVIKSCDYLNNVFIKKAALDAGVDFAVNWDREGFLAEGSAENIFLISPDGGLLVPDFERVLKGITVSRVIELARTLMVDGLLTDIRTTRVDRALAHKCPEVMLCGTTLDVLPVTLWDGRRVGDGRAGPVARRLLELLRHDIINNDRVLTDMFD